MAQCCSTICASKIFDEFQEKHNKTAGQHRHTFRPTKKFLINFCKQLKNEKTALNLVVETFPQTSIPPLISTSFGNIGLSGLRSKFLNTRYFSWTPLKKLEPSCEILKVENQPAREKDFDYKVNLTTSHLFPDFSLWNYKCGEYIS